MYTHRFLQDSSLSVAMEKESVMAEEQEKALGIYYHGDIILITINNYCVIL